MERLLFHLPRTIRSGRDGELLVTVSEISLVVLEFFYFFLHRLAHGRECAIDADDCLSARGDYLRLGICGRHGRLYRRRFQIGDRFGQIDLGSAPPQIRAKQSASKAAADESEFRWHSPEFLTADYADITDIQIKQLAQSSPMTQSIVA